MAELTREQLIKLITKEVLKRTTQEKPTTCDLSCSSALVIGEAKKLPKEVAEAYNCHGIEAYDGDIQSFEKIFITGLTTVELADIALGRNTKPVQCAVINALLYGKEIILYDFALEHRLFKKSCNQNFYLLLENYVKALTGFGIKLIAGNMDAATLQTQALQTVPFTGVVTETKAKELVRQGSGDIMLKKGTLLTPSAKDVFYSNSRQVRFIEFEG